MNLVGHLRFFAISPSSFRFWIHKSTQKQNCALIVAAYAYPSPPGPPIAARNGRRIRWVFNAHAERTCAATQGRAEIRQQLDSV